MALEKWKINFFCKTTLKILFINVVCHVKMHLYVYFVCIIMKGAMDVAIPQPFGVTTRFVHVLCYFKTIACSIA
jgi:hypothetical protein